MNRGAEIGLYAMMLILPLSALLARRVPLGETLKMALAWIAVFAVGLVIVGQRDRLKPIWDDTRDALFVRDQRVKGGFPRVLGTANGDVIALNAELPELRIGGIVARDLPVVVADAFGDTDILGMNFLSRLASWRVDGQTLVLDPSRTPP